MYTEDIAINARGICFAAANQLTGFLVIIIDDDLFDPADTLLQFSS